MTQNNKIQKEKNIKNLVRYLLLFCYLCSVNMVFDIFCFMSPVILTVSFIWKVSMTPCKSMNFYYLPYACPDSVS